MRKGGKHFIARGDGVFSDRARLTRLFRETLGILQRSLGVVARLDVFGDIVTMEDDS